MSYKSASRHSTPPVSTRSRPSPKPGRSPLNSSRESGSPSPDSPNKLNFTLYGAPAPFTALRHRGSKTSKHSRLAPPPPTSPEEKQFFSSGVVILKNSPKTPNGIANSEITEVIPQDSFNTEGMPQDSFNTEGIPQESPHEALPRLNTSSLKSPLSSFPSHRSVSPLDLSSLKDDDDDDDDVVESVTRKLVTDPSNDLSKSTSIDILSGSSSSSSIAPLSGCSTQTCTSLPRDDSTMRSQYTDAGVFQNGDVSKRSELPIVAEGSGSYENSSVGSGSSPGHRRYVLDRLESGYYSPDTVDVRFSVSEVIEAADYANRLAELLDQALGRELGFEHTDGNDPPRSISLTPNMLRNGDYREATHAAAMYEEERNKFFENVGGHPVFQNVINKIELFESGHRIQGSNATNGRVTRYFRGGVSVDREEVNVPLPPPLPYEGFKTVHDERCYCCGPKLFHLSADDLQRQRSMLKKVPVKVKAETPEDPAGMNLQEILKSVISKRRDVFKPMEEPNHSVRSDWSENDSSVDVNK